MDSEILEQLKNIGQQLEKITKLLEEKKSFEPRKSFGARKPFGDKKPFGRSSDRGGFDRGFERKDRFNSDGKPRVIADGRGFGFGNKKRGRF